MIRVWGGGVYEDDRFYDLTDTYGILIWHDLMFACAMYPVFPDFLNSVREEVHQNVRRIQSHPSVAIWATNNENEVALVQNWYHTGGDRARFEQEYRKLYIDVVKKEVEATDPWRECLSSSPSNGRQTEAEGWISKDPQDWHFGDIHYYNYDLDAWNPTIYPRPRFVSEYGFQSLPSLRALESTLLYSDNISQMIDHRQHSPLRNFPMTILIKRHLPLESLTGNPQEVLEAYIYFSQVSQAMAVKTETEVYRANRIGPMNTMGALYWQLNDVWVAPSWSSIEFNGNYKILQHWVKQFMAPLHIIPLVDSLKNLKIYVVRDTLGDNQEFTVRLHLHHWAGFDVKLEKSWSLEMVNFSIDMHSRNPIGALHKDRHSVDAEIEGESFFSIGICLLLDKFNSPETNLDTLRCLFLPKMQNRISSGTGKISGIEDYLDNVEFLFTKSYHWFSFSVSDEILASKYIILTFHGVDTIGQVHFNGVEQKSITTGKYELDNMFIRHRFNIKNLIMEPYFKSFSYLTVTLTSPVTAAKSLAQQYPTTPPECPPNASFSWDWGPAVPSSGLWKPVVLEYYNSVLIRDITVKLEENLEEDLWFIHMVVYIEAGSSVSDVRGTLRVILADFPGSENSFRVDDQTDNRGELALSLTVNVSRSDVELWWPNG
uniref:beta-mannosidase n=1 Tax=Phlebotomus papatasi TaxID=29031 RepID=A0A1B0GQ50_PHLPP